MNIYLIRHGETDWNREGRLQGHTDIPLNQKGRQQVRQASEILAGLHPDIRVILSSPLSRARESAGIAASRLSYPQDNIIVEPMLIERSFGLGEGLSAAERKEKYPDGLYPGMELLEDLLKRARSLFYHIVETYEDQENILIVAHGAILYAIFTAIMDGRIVYRGESAPLDQGSVYLIRYEKGNISLGKFDAESVSDHR